jgi:thiol-disulfide isomerase/thioredoxin
MRFLLPILLLLIAACTPEPSTRIVLTGVAKGLPDTTLSFTYDPYAFLATTQKVQVTFEKGTFKIAVESGVPVKGFFSFGRVPKTYDFTIRTVEGKDSAMSVESADFRMVYVWLEPGDSVTMDLNVERIPETLTFKGQGGVNCLFVNQEADRFDDYKHKYLGNYYNYTYRQPDDFKRVTDELLKEKLGFLKEYTGKNRLSNFMVETYSNDYLTDAIRTKVAYPGSHAGFNQGREAVLPADYYAFLDSASLGEIGNRGIGQYYYLSSVLHRKFDLKYPGDAENRDFYQFVKEQLPGKPYYEFLAYSLARDFRKVLYDQFGPECPFPEIASKVKERYQAMEGMLEGSQAPDFTLMDVNGKPVSLSSLKGRFVYIDFWATWCVPCIKEIPDLKKIQEQFKGRNIEFVSISFDKETDKIKWQNYVIDNNLQGIQLLVDPTVKELLSKTFNIDLIPRFILLDPDGRVVNANAPRPSNPKLPDLLNKSGV